MKVKATSSVGINLTWTLILCPGIKTPVGGMISKWRGLLLSLSFCFLRRCIGTCFSACKMKQIVLLIRKPETQFILTCTYIQYIIWILYNMIILSTVLKYLFLVSPFWVLSRWGGNSTHTWPAVDWTAEQWLLYTPHTWHQRSPECHLRSPCRASSRWPSVSPESLDHSGSSKQNRKCRSISEIHCVKYQVIIKHTSSGNIECYTDWHNLHESSNFLKRYI